jgi:hypothetical protein
MTKEKRRLEDELDLYKPVLLSLVVVLACTGVWLLVLALTGNPLLSLVSGATLNIVRML